MLIGLVALGKRVLEVRRLRRITRSGIKEIDVMDGTTFERYLTTLFDRLGYRAEHTGRRGDYGADLVIAKDGLRTAVQAKRWTKKVGVGAVQEAVAARGYYQCDEALVVSNRLFTEPARRLARANGVKLWGRAELIPRLLAAGAPQDSLPAVAPIPLEPAVCETCGMNVSEKVRDYCLAHAVRFSGRIYCFRHQRTIHSVPSRAN